METRNKPKAQETAIEQRSSSELVEGIRKLRWMGLEHEPECLRMERALGRRPPADSVIAAPGDTD